MEKVNGHEKDPETNLKSKTTSPFEGTSPACAATLPLIVKGLAAFDPAAPSRPLTLYINWPEGSGNLV